jgi:DNA-binding NarL/FixJ family response regulator
MIRVLVQASSEVAQAGLEALLRAQSTIQIVRRTHGREASNPETVEGAADVVLVELQDPEDELQRDALHHAASGTAVVVLAHETTTEWIREMLRSGVRAILSPNGTGPEIIAAIEAAFAGLLILHPSNVDVLSSAQNSGSNSAVSSTSEPLTSREGEVLQLLALGLANKEIAARMEISEHTVKFHVASIMGKLGAASRTEAVTLGIRRGIVMI